MNYQLDIQPPWLYQKQWDFLRLNRESPNIHWSHWVGGRGSAKSNTGIQLAVDSCLRLNPGLPGIWTAPTHKDLIDTFLREFQRIVPQELYVLVKSEMKIRFINGSEIDLRSREKAHVGRGPNYAWAIHDEAAAGFDERLYGNITAAVRHPKAKCRFVSTLTTPALNGYQHMAQTDGHVLVQSSSYDNPFLPDDYADELGKHLDPEYARQEIYGEFISLSGRAWKYFEETDYPRGNLAPIRYNRNKPYYLACDIGLRSSWLIIQRYMAQELGGRGNSTVHVVVGEYQPNNQDTSRTVQRINEDYGVPHAIYCGADAGTKNIVTGVAAEYVFANMWGSVPVVPATGDSADKELQYITTSAQILNTKGDRSLLVSRKLHSHDPTKRGILEMMRQDSFAEAPRGSEFLPKDKGKNKYSLEDTRDSLEYYIIGTCQPTMFRTNSWAA